MTSTRYNTPKVFSIAKCLTKEPQKIERFLEHKETKKFEDEPNKATIIKQYKKKTTQNARASAIEAILKRGCYCSQTTSST